MPVLKSLPYKSCIVLLFTFCLLSPYVKGQETKKKWIFSGDAGIYGDFYSIQADTPGAVAARRPGSMGRLAVNSSLSHGHFSLPVSIILSDRHYSVIYPQPPKGNLIDFIRNPANQVGIAPKYKWAQVLLGTQVPQYSELSVGDLPVFGAGIHVTPGKFRFSVFAGTSQLAIEEDTAKNIPGIFARKIYSGKIGYGDEDATHAYFITSLMEDDTSSLGTEPVNTMPQKGVLSALDYKIKIGKQYAVKGEIAGSAFTRDTRSKTASFHTPPFDIPGEIFQVQEASRFDYASVLSIGKEGKKVSINLTGKYIGDGFVPLGYPFMQTDRMEASIDPRLNLFSNKIQFSGSIGKRFNNLSGTRMATTTQTIASANINYQCTEKLSLASSFSNFDFRNSLKNDTFIVQMVTLSLDVSPVYTHTTPLNMHVFTAVYAQNTFKDFNTISGALNDNDSRNAVLSYMLSKINTPLSLNGMLSYFDNNASFGKLATNSLNIGMGYQFLKKKLKTSADLTYTGNRLNSDDAGSQVTTTLGLKYTLKKKIDLGMNGSVNLFKYGTDRPGISYRENLLRTSVTYRL